MDNLWSPLLRLDKICDLFRHRYRMRWNVAEWIRNCSRQCCRFVSEVHVLGSLISHLLGGVIRDIIFTCEYKIFEFSFDCLQRYLDVIFLGRLSSISFKGSFRIKTRFTKCGRRIYAASILVSDSIRVNVGFARASLLS